MRYMLMSNIEPAQFATMTPDEMQATMQRFIDFTQALADSGILRGAEQLHDADTATTVRVRDDKLLLTDGPFADVTEQFGGYWIIEAADLDTALKHAQECPAVTFGSVEVRAVTERG